MIRLNGMVVAQALLMATASAAPLPTRTGSEVFLVNQSSVLSFLRADGEEQEPARPLGHWLVGGWGPLVDYISC
jgi:hypothetical protein